MLAYSHGRGAGLPPPGVRKMARDLPEKIAELRAEVHDLRSDFQRIADRAAWVRARWIVKGNQYLTYALGRADEDGMVRGCQGAQELALITELQALTER